MIHTSPADSTSRHCATVDMRHQHWSLHQRASQHRWSWRCPAASCHVRPGLFPPATTPKAPPICNRTYNLPAQDHMPPHPNLRIAVRPLHAQLSTPGRPQCSPTVLATTKPNSCDLPPACDGRPRNRVHHVSRSTTTNDKGIPVVSAPRRTPRAARPRSLRPGSRPARVPLGPARNSQLIPSYAVTPMHPRAQGMRRYGKSSASAL